MSHLFHQNISLCACVCVPNPGFTHAGQASYHQPTTAANIFLKTRKTYYKLRKIPQISQNPGKQQCLGLLFETGSVSFRLALNLRSSHLCLMSSGITSGSLYLAYTFIFYNLFFYHYRIGTLVLWHTRGGRGSACRRCFSPATRV